MTLGFLLSRFDEARWFHSWRTVDHPYPVSFGWRRYWRRRMSDLQRTIRRRFHVEAEGC